jgi:hypothetical protein
MAPLSNPQLGCVNVGLIVNKDEGVMVKVELDLQPVAVSVTVTV